ncbi:MAG: 50S ribosomal protein L18 [Pseudomonadota bacterium]|nr:50S ribosomal protein L18 [Pseudomonadota bacterium]
MNIKKKSRMKRALKTRANIRSKNSKRLCVYRSPRHIYAQIISESGSTVLATASTVEKIFRESGAHCGNVLAAEKIGTLIAERAQEVGVKEIAFDRSGYRYHGRIKALADAARNAGLIF